VSGFILKLTNEIWKNSYYMIMH